MTFAKAQPVCIPCYEHYYCNYYKFSSTPLVPGICVRCGNMKENIYYVRLDPMKVPYPKVRKTKPRQRKKIVHHK